MIHFDDKGRLQINPDVMNDDKASTAMVTIVVYAYNTIMLRKVSGLMIWAGLAGLYIAKQREKKFLSAKEYNYRHVGDVE